MRRQQGLVVLVVAGVVCLAAFPEARLTERVPGKKEAHHTFYYMLHGVAQHELYHAGQMALLKKK